MRARRRSSSRRRMRSARTPTPRGGTWTWCSPRTASPWNRGLAERRGAGPAHPLGRRPVAPQELLAIGLAGDAERQHRPDAGGVELVLEDARLDRARVLG